MSRVFDALVRARQHQAEQGPPFVNGHADTFHEEPTVSSEPRAADSPVTTVTQPLPTPAAPQRKTWQERLQEFVFGWDLGRYTKYPLMVDDTNSPASEQYKILREQLKSLTKDAGLSAFAISSPVKGDGKTTVAVNLAVAMALNYEQRVLLIDGDLRGPQVHRYFNLSSSPGLTDYLSSSSKLEIHTLIKQTKFERLHVVPAGNASSRPSELLASDRMKHLLEGLRKQFANYTIIIDAPPVLATADSLALAHQVDGVLLVVRAGKTPREFVHKSVEALNSAHVVGIVFNGAELGLAAQYFRYSSTALNSTALN